MNASWLDRINLWVFRLRHAWAVGSFSLGLASYFMVERKPWLAAVLTAFLVTTWLVLLTENLWSRRFRGTAMEQVSQGALKLLLQGVHQEAFFFSLPFVVLQWSGGAEYFLFTALVAGAALVSIVDPLYFRLARHRALFFGSSRFSGEKRIDSRETGKLVVVKQTDLPSLYCHDECY